MADDWLGISSTELDSLCGEEEEFLLAYALAGEGVWHHEANEVHWFVLDLGQTYTIKKVRGRSNAPSDPIDVNIYIDNNNPPTTLCEETITTWQDTADFVEITLTSEGTGRYIKVEIANTESFYGHIEWGDPRSPFTIFDVYGDIAAGGVEHTHSASDTHAISDSLAVAATFNVTASDTLTTGDALSKAALTMPVTAGPDTLAMSDVLTNAELIMPVTAADTLSMSDALTLAELIIKATAADTLAMSDVLTSVVATFNVNLADTLAMSDASPLAAATYNVALDDTLNMSDNVIAAAAYAVALADTLAISDNVLSGWVFYVAVADTLGITDSLTVEMFEAAVKAIRKKRAIAGFKPARVSKVGRVGL